MSHVVMNVALHCVSKKLNPLSDADINSRTDGKILIVNGSWQMRGILIRLHSLMPPCF